MAKDPKSGLILKPAPRLTERSGIGLDHISFRPGPILITRPAEPLMVGRCLQ